MHFSGIVLWSVVGSLSRVSRLVHCISPGKSYHATVTQGRHLFTVYIVECVTGGRTLVGATGSEEGATALSALLGVVATLAQGDRMALPGHRRNVTV